MREPDQYSYYSYQPSKDRWVDLDFTCKDEGDDHRLPLEEALALLKTLEMPQHGESALGVSKRKARERGSE